MPPLDIPAVRRELLHLDLAIYAPLKGALAEFVHFYGIDMEAQVAGVRHYAGWYESPGYQIAAHVFMPTSAQGTVFILHGYLDHAGLYRHLIRDCLQKGYAVVIPDLPGHGLSSGERTDIPDFDDYQLMLESFVSQYGEELTGPWYGVGQSTGGAILMDHVLTTCADDRKPFFQSVLLLAPLLRPSQWQKVRFGYGLMRHFRVAIPRVFRNNSSDKDFLRFVREEDPLQARWVPMNWIGSLRRWVLRMVDMPSCEFPVLLVQGERDETVEWRGNNDFVRTRFHVVHEAILPEASHQLANEREDLRQPVHQALAILLNQKNTVL
ncbi:MAG: alpha/beta hydrolase [Moraxellaceae bacterium]|nr:alpha/beta hydrolase [Moraxellaceae bacterium]